MAKFPLWRWKAIDERGQLQRGITLAEDRITLYQHLLEQQLQPVALRKAPVARRRCWHIRHKIDVIRQLATLLQAGIPLTDGLTLIARQHPVAEWSALLKHIGRQVSQGVSLSEALKQWPAIFPPLFIALIHTGELTGKLAECCQRLAEQQERQYLLRKKVIKALRYPFFILLIALLVTVGMVGFVLPEFANIYQAFNAPLPAVTLAVINISEYVTRQGGWWAAGGGISVISWLTIRQRKPAWQEREQRLLLKIPLLTPLWRGQVLSQIFTMLTLSQQAGIPLLQGLEAVEKTLSWRLWQRTINNINQQVTEGVPLWQAIDSAQGFTPLCRQLIHIGEESGSLDLMLERLANWHYDKTQELADNLAATLEPIMMIVIGLIIGTLVLAMYLPIFQLGDAITLAETGRNIARPEIAPQG